MQIGEKLMIEEKDVSIEECKQYKLVPRPFPCSSASASGREFFAEVQVLRPSKMPASI